MKKVILLSLIFLLASTNSFAQIIQSHSETKETFYVKTEEKKLFPRYQGEFNFGYITPLSAFAETVHGVRINKYLFTGLGLGFRYSTDLTAYSCKEIEYHPFLDIHFPIFVNVKGYYPISNKIEPYLNLSLGYAVSINSHNGFYCDFGTGIRLWKFTIGMGLMHRSFSKMFLELDQENTGQLKFPDHDITNDIPLEEYNKAWTWKSTGFYLKFGFQW